MDAAAPACAAGRDTHVLLLGDSTLRFQYLSLAFAWRHGHELQQAEEANMTGNVVQHSMRLRGWQQFNWSSFFERTSVMIGDQCDCHRSGACCFGRTPAMENRFARFRCGAQLTYLQLWGRMPMKGTWWPGHPERERSVHRRWAPKWTMPAFEVIRKLLPLLRPTVVVFNLGHHLKSALTEPELQRFGQAFGNLTSTRVVWATTMSCIGPHPACRPSKLSYDGPATEEFAARDFIVFDAAAHTRNLKRLDFRDNMHVGMHVNNCLNERLIRTLWPHAPAAWPWRSCERLKDELS